MTSHSKSISTLATIILPWFVSKLFLEMLQGLIKFILCHKIAAVMTQLQETSELTKAITQMSYKAIISPWIFSHIYFHEEGIMELDAYIWGCYHILLIRTLLHKLVTSYLILADNLLQLVLSWKYTIVLVKIKGTPKLGYFSRSRLISDKIVFQVIYG